MVRYGIAYKTKTGRAKFEWFPSEFERNMNAKSLRDLGFKVRHIKKGEAEKKRKGRWI